VCVCLCVCACEFSCCYLFSVPEMVNKVGLIQISSYFLTELFSGPANAIDPQRVCVFVYTIR